jgi:hypothetical protein
MRNISLIMAFILTTLTIDSSYAQSKMIPTMEVIETVSFKKEREKVISFMEKTHIQKQMIEMGVDPREAIERVSRLSSQEVKKLAQEIDQLPAGADFGIGSIVGAAVFLFIVLLVTDILGFTKVFPFTRSVN